VNSDKEAPYDCDSCREMIDAGYTADTVVKHHAMFAGTCIHQVRKTKDKAA
jgi:hypothetical protein